MIFLSLSKKKGFDNPEPLAKTQYSLFCELSEAME